MSRAAPTVRTAAGPLPVAVALLTVYVVWGSTYLAIAYMVDSMPPFLSAAARYLVAGVVMLGFLWIYGRARRGSGERERPTLAHWRSAFILGTLLLLGGNGFVVLAEQPGLLSSGIAAVLVATTPISMNVLEAILQRRRPSALVVGGVLAGFVGVVILLFPAEGVAAVSPYGVLLVLIAELSWAIGSVYQRRAPLPRSPWLGTGMEMLAGGAVLFAVGTLTGEPGRTDVTSFTGESLLALLYLIVFGSLIAFSAYVWLLHNAPISTVATYAYVNPIIAVALGAWLRAEDITPRTLLAAAIIIGAVIAMVTGRPRDVEEPGGTPEAATAD